MASFHAPGLPNTPTAGLISRMITAELLETASWLEATPLLGSPTPHLADLCARIGVLPPTAEVATLPPERILTMHGRLASLLRQALSATYISELGSGPRPSLRLRPRNASPVCGVLALHGAMDHGASFAGVFAEMASLRPIELYCPSSDGEIWGGSDTQTVRGSLHDLAPGKPLFVVGLSAGASYAWSLRAEVPERTAGIVAISGAPWSAGEVRGTVPVLFLHGRQDALFSLREVLHFAKQLERVEVVVMPDLGHAFPYRAVERFAWPWMSERL